jgi:twitching motility protein PilT
MSADRGLLGHIAVQQNLITREQLRAATREQARHPERRLGEILVALGFIDETQLRQLLATQRQLSKRREKQIRRPTPPPVKRNVDQVALGAIALKRITKDSMRQPDDGNGSADDGKSRTVAFAIPRKPDARSKESDARKWLAGVLSDAASCGGTAVIFRPDEPVRVRRFGRLQDLTSGPVPGPSVERLLLEAIDDESQKRLDQHGHVRVIYEHLEAGRFRLDVFRHVEGYGAAFHPLPREAPTFEDIGLPSALAGLTNFLRGLVLIAGPSGCGKSMTLAAMINLINTERSDHIVTIEDMVECVHRPSVASISQLQVPRGVDGRPRSLERALAIDPDVVAIDAIVEDAELVEALDLAESGHLVLGTIAGQSSAHIIERAVDAIADERSTACRRVANSLRAVFAPRLLPATGEGGVVVAFELIYIDPLIAKAIREDAISKIPTIVESGRSRGSRLLDDSLAHLVRGGFISADLAAVHAHHPNNFVAT